MAVKDQWVKVTDFPPGFSICRELSLKIQEMIVEDCDSRWPHRYEAEKERVLHGIGGQVAGIEHIGSTAVPGLSAKPMIDIMIGVREMSIVEGWRGLLADLGYVYEFSHPHWCHFNSGRLDSTLNA